MYVLPGWSGSVNVNGSRKLVDQFCSLVWYLCPSGRRSGVTVSKPFSATAPSTFSTRPWLSEITGSAGFTSWPFASR